MAHTVTSAVGSAIVFLVCLALLALHWLLLLKSHYLLGDLFLITAILDMFFWFLMAIKLQFYTNGSILFLENAQDCR